ILPVKPAPWHDRKDGVRSAGAICRTAPPRLLRSAAARDFSRVQDAGPTPSRSRTTEGYTGRFVPQRRCATERYEEPGGNAVTDWTTRLLNFRRGELPLALLAALFYFCVLCGYFFLRPVREALGVSRGMDDLRWLFVATSVGSLVIVMMFG